LNLLTDRQARAYLGDLVAGRVLDIAEIAAREQRSVRSASMLLSLAFLAPDLVKATAQRRLPRGIGLTRMMDLPADWAEHYQALGLLPNLVLGRIKIARRRMRIFRPQTRCSIASLKRADRPRELGRGGETAIPQPVGFAIGDNGAKRRRRPCRTKPGFMFMIDSTRFRPVEARASSRPRPV
jgi:hypothetical protein